MSEWHIGLRPSAVMANTGGSVEGEHRADPFLLAKSRERGNGRCLCNCFSTGRGNVQCLYDGFSTERECPLERRKESSLGAARADGRE